MRIPETCQICTTERRSRFAAMARTALLALLVPLVVAVGPAAARPACTPGVKTADGVTERTFCGPAKATVHDGAKTFVFSDGECEKTSKYVAVNIGTVVLGTTSKPKPNYFGLDVGQIPGTTGKPAAKDGSYPAAALALDYGGKGYLATGVKVVLAGNRTHGSLSGSALGSSAKVTGTFSC
jgi:hypothetical protein